jgi:hypothetical protein
MTIIWIQLGNVLEYGFIKNPEQSFQERRGDLAQMNNLLQIPRLWLTNSVVSGIRLDCEKAIDLTKTLSFSI